MLSSKQNSHVNFCSLLCKLFFSQIRMFLLCLLLHVQTIRAIYLHVHLPFRFDNLIELHICQFKLRKSNRLRCIDFEPTRVFYFQILDNLNLIFNYDAHKFILFFSFEAAVLRNMTK